MRTGATTFRLCLALTLAVSMVPAAVVLADYYEDFADGEWEGDPDPNVWDIDNPHWEMMNLAGFYVVEEIVGQYKALRLFADSVVWPYAADFAMPEDGDYDPDTSATYWDDTTNHYVLCRSYYPGNLYSSDPDDPNNDTGVALILMHTDPLHWTSFTFGWNFHNCAYVPVGQPYSWEAHHHYNQHINLGSSNGIDGLNIQRLWIDPNGVREPWSLDPNTSDPNDTTWLEPPEPHNERDPNYDNTEYLGMGPDAWERQGFWMVMQFEQDPNYETGDPNGKFLRAAFWLGDKYDWDGRWRLSQELSHPYWSGGNPLDWYWAEGKTAVGAVSAEPPLWGAGLPADAAYDDFEARTGVFTNVSRTLDLKIKNAKYGLITIDPDLAHPNDAYDPNTLDPNDPDTHPSARLLRYTDGTEIVLVATVTEEGRQFKNWKIYDPNHPGDGNYIALDSNTVLYLTMEADYQVQAIFKCGTGQALLPIGVVLVVLGSGLRLRRGR